MSNRGTQRENFVKDWLEERGWWVARAAGSLGDADLAAMKDAESDWFLPMIDEHPLTTGKLLVEVKSTKAGPFSKFGPKDRAELLKAGEIAGADVVLCWTPPSPHSSKPVELHWYWPEDWPAATPRRDQN